MISSGHCLWHHGYMTQDIEPDFDFSPYAIPWIKQKLEEGEEVDALELAKALRECGDNPRGFNITVREHIALHLEGKIRKRRGRKKVPEVEYKKIAGIFGHFYRRYYQHIRARGLREPTLRQHVRPKNQEVWQGPPHEIAYRLTARHCGLDPDGWEYIRTLSVSKLVI